MRRLPEQKLALAFRAAPDDEGLKNENFSFAVLTNTRSVGVMGDERAYDYTLDLRAVTTADFMPVRVGLISREDEFLSRAAGLVAATFIYP